MAFDVTADAYGRFMGRWSEQLSGQLADLAGVAPGQRVLDVGCGPGVLTTVLVDRVGADHVRAVDPSEPFVAAARGAGSRASTSAGPPPRTCPSPTVRSTRRWRSSSCTSWPTR